MEDRARCGEKEMGKPTEWWPFFGQDLSVNNQECGSFDWGWFWRWCVWFDFRPGILSSQMHLGCHQAMRYWSYAATPWPSTGSLFNVWWIWRPLKRKPPRKWDWRLEDMCVFATLVSRCLTGLTWTLQVLVKEAAEKLQTVQETVAKALLVILVRVTLNQTTLYDTYIYIYYIYIYK